MDKNSFLHYKVRHCFYSSSMNGDEFINDEIIDAMKLKFVPFSNKNFLLGVVTQVTGYPGERLYCAAFHVDYSNKLREKPKRLLMYR